MPDYPAPEKLASAITAVGSQAFGETLLSWLNEVCSFDNFAIIAFLQNSPPMVLMTKASESRVFDRIDSHYVSGAYQLDPFYGLHQSNAPSGVYRLSDIAPDQFQRNEYFKSYYRNTTLTDELVFFSTPSTGVSITVCLGRDRTTASRFSSRDQATANRVAPIVNALVSKNWGTLRSEKDTPPQDVAGELRERLLVEKGISLSGRQAEIALLILQGHSSVSIGLTLGISAQTVKVFRKQLYRKCQISSQGELFYLMAPYLSSQGAASGP